MWRSLLPSLSISTMLSITITTHRFPSFSSTFEPSSYHLIVNPGFPLPYPFCSDFSFRFPICPASHSKSQIAVKLPTGSDSTPSEPVPSLPLAPPQLTASNDNPRLSPLRLKLRQGKSYSRSPRIFFLSIL